MERRKKNGKEKKEGRKTKEGRKEGENLPSESLVVSLSKKPNVTDSTGLSNPQIKSDQSSMKINSPTQTQVPSQPSMQTQVPRQPIMQTQVPSQSSMKVNSPTQTPVSSPNPFLVSRKSILRQEK